MAPRLFDLARVATATTGTGTITLGAAVSGFLTFAQAGVSNDDTVAYGIRDGANSEYGLGTYTASGTTLARTTVIRSTAGSENTDAITLSGTAEVFLTAGSENLFAGSIYTTDSTHFDTPVSANVSVNLASAKEHVFRLQGNPTLNFGLGVTTTSIPIGAEYLIVIVQDATGGRTPTFQVTGGTPMTELNTFPTWASRPANGIDIIAAVQTTYGEPFATPILLGTHLFSGTTA